MPLVSGQKLTPATAPGWVAENDRQTTVGSITTTEAVLQSVTFTAVSTARYKISAVQSIQSTVAGDLIQMRIRWSAGAILSTSGTELKSILPNADVASKGQAQPITATVTNLSGQITVGVTAVRNSGTGTVSSFGDSRMTNTILVERV
ncbi:hypothetical protein [Micromonospora sediminicola]|uniref:hypothetical protein n=1 Tax=Micromonospora sediminicola TaxID=946078 RepID=UPI00378CA57C